MIHVHISRSSSNDSYKRQRNHETMASFILGLFWAGPSSEKGHSSSRVLEQSQFDLRIQCLLYCRTIGVPLASWQKCSQTTYWLHWRIVLFPASSCDSCCCLARLAVPRRRSERPYRVRTILTKWALLQLCASLLTLFLIILCTD